jgi:hypothetical protein
MSGMAADAFCLFSLAAWLPDAANKLAHLTPVACSISCYENQG